MKTKILIVDDHSFTRAGIRAIVENAKDLEVIGVAIDGNDAILKVEEKQPDIVIMDINMPGLSGIEATRKILLVNKKVKIIALSMHAGEFYVKEMLSAGAVGYLLKDDVPEELVKAIEKVVKGEMILSSAVTRAALVEGDEIVGLNILQTKLHRPAITKDYILRQYIIDKLENNVIHPLSVISAGAGYGKSITISSWLENSSYPNTWISLDEEHNDFRTFVMYMITAIENIFPASMKDTANLIKGGSLPPFRVIFTSLINELYQIDQDFILVLDDFHILREKKIHRFFDEWLRFPPPNVHLSIITRRDPPLNLMSLRNSGQLIELNMRDLSFSNKEISELFNLILGIELKDHHVDLLQDKTEGWIIGLRLASMVMNKKEDIGEILELMDGGINVVSEYLISEVLLKQPRIIRQQIIESSVLDRFCSDLIEEITIKNDEFKEENLIGNDLIQWLMKSNMFIISLDAEQKWYRYHHLFQQMLQNQIIKQRTEQQIYNIHSLASVWFEKNNFIYEAVQHSLKAKDTIRAIDIIENNWEDTFDMDHWYVVEGWMSLLSDELVEQSVNLLLTKLWLDQKKHVVQEIPVIIELVKKVKGELTDRETGYLSLGKCMMHLFNGDLKKTLEHAEQALRLIPKTHYIFRADTYGWWTVAMQVNGRGEEAIQSAEESLKNIIPPNEPVQMARRTMHPNFVHILNADLEPVKYNLEAFFALPKNSSYILSVGWYFKASISWWATDQEGAISSFDRVINFKYLSRPRMVVEAFICKSIALQELNRTREANRTMDQGAKFARHTKDQVNINIIKSGEIRLRLMQGEIGVAEEWLRNTKHDKIDVSMLWWVEVSSITQCRVLIAINTVERLNEAIDLLKTYRVYAESIYNKLRTIEILVLQAIAFLKLKQKKDAGDCLKEALNLAIGDKFTRPFVENGVALTALLLELKKQGIRIKFIEMILEGIKNYSSKATTENLTDQKQGYDSNLNDQYVAFTRKEMEILHCVSEGLRNAEIADKLFNSEQTIKKHLSNMFQKIQVRNRMQLTSKAKELGLLE